MQFINIPVKYPEGMDINICSILNGLDTYKYRYELEGEIIPIVSDGSKIDYIVTKLEIDEYRPHSSCISHIDLKKLYIFKEASELLLCADFFPKGRDFYLDSSLDNILGDMDPKESYGDFTIRIWPMGTKMEKSMCIYMELSHPEAIKLQELKSKEFYQPIIDGKFPYNGKKYTITHIEAGICTCSYEEMEGAKKHRYDKCTYVLYFYTKEKDYSSNCLSPWNASLSAEEIVERGYIQYILLKEGDTKQCKKSRVLCKLYPGINNIYL